MQRKKKSQPPMVRRYLENEEDIASFTSWEIQRALRSGKGVKIHAETEVKGIYCVNVIYPPGLDTIDNGGWEEYEAICMTVDRGAMESVIKTFELASVERIPSAGSRAGV